MRGDRAIGDFLEMAKGDYQHSASPNSRDYCARRRIAPDGASGRSSRRQAPRVDPSLGITIPRARIDEK
jgi:hypothetical protein